MWLNSSWTTPVTIISFHAKKVFDRVTFSLSVMSRFGEAVELIVDVVDYIVYLLTKLKSLSIIG